jgi:HK97 family phage prohead protease
MNIQKRTFLTVVRATGDEPSMAISTAAVDRDADVLQPSGARLDNYRKNPVVLFGHKYDAIPVGVSTSIEMHPFGLVASWKRLEGDEFASRVRNAFDQGVLRAASVGFKPLASQPRKGGGSTYTEWDLLEWSIVAVPANPEAVRTLKSAGLWTPAIEKAGRVLSSMNESHIREALEHATGCGDHLAQVLAALEPDDVEILELDDDEQVEVEESDVRAAFASVRADLAADLRSLVAQTVRRETSRIVNRGRLVDDDPLMLDRVRHRARPMADADEIVDIDPETFAAALADVLPVLARQVLAETIREIPKMIDSAIRQSRGRLD